MEELIEEKGIVYINHDLRKIYFFTEVDRESVCQTICFLDELESISKEDIELHICSGGGCIYSGLALYNRLRQSKCKIITHGSGLVGSMACIIFLAGDYRKLDENAVLMNHQGTSEIGGRVNDIKIEVAETKRLEQLTCKITSIRTGLPIAKINKDIKKGDDYIDCKRALKEGFIDEIIANNPDPIRVPKVAEKNKKNIKLPQVENTVKENNV